MIIISFIMFSFIFPIKRFKVQFHIEFFRGIANTENSVFSAR